MRTVVYRGPSDILRSGGRTFYRGEPEAVSEALYRQLMRDRGARIETLDSPKPVEEPAPPAEEAASDTADTGEEESD